MSGSNAGSFVSAWSPYATQAGQALGISPALILQQWGFESGYGTNPATLTGNNPGGIMSGGSLANYANAASFTQSYINTIEGNFPGAVGAGSNAGQFLSGLQNGTAGTYWDPSQTATTYGMGLAGVGNNLAAAAPGTYASLTGGQPLQGSIGQGGPMINVTGDTTGAATGSGGTSGSVTGSGGSGPPGSPCAGVAGIFSGACWQSIGADVLLVVLGLALIVFSAGAGFLGDRSTVVDVITPTHGGVG